MSFFVLPTCIYLVEVNNGNTKTMRNLLKINIKVFLKILLVLENTAVSINPLTTSVPHHIETSQLICIANQLTGFCMMGNIGW